MNGSETNTNMALAQIDRGNLDVLNLNLSADLAGSLELLKKIVSSKRLGDKVTTVEGALSAYIKTRELGLPFISGVEGMFEIGGKSGLNVHAMRALVLRAGVIHWEEVYNFTPLYKYIDSSKQVIAKGVDETCLPDIYELLTGTTVEEQEREYKRITSIGKKIVLKDIDKVVYSDNGHSIFNYSTKYRFTRDMPNGKQIVEYGEFSMAEAFAAGLHLRKDGTINLNSAWLTYTRNALEHRAWSFGARKIADDILFGMLEATELFDVEKIDYTFEGDRAKVIQKDITNN